MSLLTQIAGRKVDHSRPSRKYHTLDHAQLHAHIRGRETSVEVERKMRKSETAVRYHYNSGGTNISRPVCANRTTRSRSTSGVLSDGGKTGSDARTEVPEEDEEHDDGEVTDETQMPKVAAGKALNILMKMESPGECEVETASVYGAALVIPQIARSTGWSGTFTALSLRAYLLLIFNIILQMFLLSMIGTEQLMLYPFSGRMHLCDFGASIPRCDEGSTNAANCRGPGGTVMSYDRLYSYRAWAVRRFFHESLSELFPDMTEQINVASDPGEYGLESYYCRIACVFIFMMAVVDDFGATMELALMLLSVPSEAQPWISYEISDNSDADFGCRELTDLDYVSFEVAGMPLIWKVVNFFVILIPKFALWLGLASSGVHYLMETAEIMTMVVNAMALTFVLDIDELVFARLATGMTKQIMERVQSLQLWDASEEQSLTDKQVLQRFEREELGWGNRLSRLSVAFPFYALKILAFQAFFMMLYYMRNCVSDGHGGQVSKAMFLPKDLLYNPLRLMFGIEPAGEEEVFWTMPDLKPDL
eukprot:TRINITY_DN47247_c0_g1_i1.p1 TRINITY_DN47247_c0_g1~~TRINITY_DN47247_c0_g1_i1.p1  ORF type:complete len:534 (+),score=95.29 TRINITY_DN47247_c0_g1_i1:142-1743(+)